MYEYDPKLLSIFYITIKAMSNIRFTNQLLNFIRYNSSKIRIHFPLWSIRKERVTYSLWAVGKQEGGSLSVGLETKHDNNSRCEPKLYA